MKNENMSRLEKALYAFAFVSLIGGGILGIATKKGEYIVGGLLIGGASKIAAIEYNRKQRTKNYSAKI